MSTLRDDAIEALKKSPKDATANDLMYRIYVLDRIHRGEEDIKAGRTMTQEALEKKAAKWK